jgi:hypothetical protein
MPCKLLRCLASAEEEFRTLANMNGKLGDNPLSDLTIHGVNRFPEDFKEMLLKIEQIGRKGDRWPLGENWPFSLAEFEWAEGKGLDEGRELLGFFIMMLESGRGDEVMVDSITQKPFSD